jgi:hypothetical protein
MAATPDHTLGIYVRGVGEDTTETDCRAAFSRFGRITEVVLKVRKFSQLQPFIAVFSLECMGQLAPFGPT